MFLFSNALKIDYKIVKMPNWIPISSIQEQEYKNYGKIMSDTSVLGRFFKLSMFAEDDPKVVGAFFSNASGTQMSNEILNMIGKQLHPLQALVKV